MRSPVVAIVNRRARHLGRPGALLTAFRSPHPRLESIETADLAELDAVADELAATPPAVVVLAGGDGSHMAGMSALTRAFEAKGTPLPAMALAPGGTANTVARNWGYGGGGFGAGGLDDAVEHVHALLDAIAAGTTTRTLRPTLRLSLPDGPSRTGFIFGAGLVSRFFEVYEAEGAGGYATAARIVAKIFAGALTSGKLARRVLTPGRCDVLVDDGVARLDRISLVAASVVTDLGLGLRLLYRAAHAPPGRFHLVATDMRPRQLGPQLPLVLAGRPLLGPRVDTLAERLVLAFPHGEGSCVLDGELFVADHVTLEPGPPFWQVGLGGRGQAHDGVGDRERRGAVGDEDDRSLAAKRRDPS